MNENANTEQYVGLETTILMWKNYGTSRQSARDLVPVYFATGLLCFESVVLNLFHPPHPKHFNLKFTHTVPNIHICFHDYGFVYKLLKIKQTQCPILHWIHYLSCRV